MEGGTERTSLVVLRVVPKNVSGFHRGSSPLAEPWMTLKRSDAGVTRPAEQRVARWWLRTRCDVGSARRFNLPGRRDRNTQRQRGACRSRCNHASELAPPIVVRGREARRAESRRIGKQSVVLLQRLRSFRIASPRIREAVGRPTDSASCERQLPERVRCIAIASRGRALAKWHRQRGVLNCIAVTADGCPWPSAVRRAACRSPARRSHRARGCDRDCASVP